MYPKETFCKDLAYNYVSCFFKGIVAFKQVTELESNAR